MNKLIITSSRRRLIFSVNGSNEWKEWLLEELKDTCRQYEKQKELYIQMLNISLTGLNENVSTLW